MCIKMTVTKWMRLEGAGNTIFSGASLSKLAEGEEKSWSFWLSNHSFPWNYVLESMQFKWYHIAILFDGFVVELKMILWQVSTFKTSRLVAGRSPKQMMEERSEILLYLDTFVCVTACINTYCTDTCKKTCLVFCLQIVGKYCHLFAPSHLRRIR